MPAGSIRPRGASGGYRYLRQPDQQGRECEENEPLGLTYLGTLRRHGRWLDQVTEPLPEPDWNQAHDADRKPVFLVARLVKLPPD